MPVGFGCWTASGMRMSKVTKLYDEKKVDVAFSWHELILLYAICLGLTGIVHELAWNIPALTQGILAITFIRFGLLYLIFNRLMNPDLRFGWISLFLGGEIALGFTGFFAGFRESLIMAMLALLTRTGRWRTHQLVALGTLAGVILMTGVIWMGIKVEYRHEITSGMLSDSAIARLARVGSLAYEWLSGSVDNQINDLERMVDRLWAIYYPARAVSMVPDVLPHEDGRILLSAIRHVFMPRLFFQDKERLESDSEMVRRYTGASVAGEEQGTSIAFGYAVESYVDFGVPLMFVPVFIYGFMMGVAYVAIFRLIRHRELAIAMASILFWVSLYLFERSWVKTLGLAATLLLFLGGAVFLLDQFLLYRASKRKPSTELVPSA